MKDTESIIGTIIKGEPLKDALIMGFSVLPAITVIAGIIISAIWLAVQIGFQLFESASWLYKLSS